MATLRFYSSNRIQDPQDHSGVAGKTGRKHEYGSPAKLFGFYP